MLLVVNADTPASMLNTLKKMRYDVVLSMKHPRLSGAISTHPDMQLHLLDDKIAITPPECYDYYRSELPKTITLLAGKTRLDGTYPFDCAYNVTRINNLIVCNTKCVDQELLAYYRARQFRIIHTNQGYTKCNMALIGDECILTEDVGIHNIITENLLPCKVVLLSGKEVRLNGFPYGFIGGTCGGIGKTLFWYGNPEKTSYNQIIKTVTLKAGVSNIPLSPEPLEDFGGIICFPR